MKKQFRKTLLLGLSFVLVAAVAIAGTVAYLTDTDSKTNVMTVGSVHIEQIEQERDANGDLVDFTQAKPALPAVGDIQWDSEGVDVNGTEYKVFADELKNVVDKIVTVKNTGKSDAYVRTIIAIEAPDGDPNNLIHVNINPDGLSYTAWTPVEINGVDYVISTFTYEKALAKGEISAPSLMQVFLDKKTTNEDCEKFGKTWDILVLSQAVQAAGFSNAQTALDKTFGEITATNHPWIIADVIDDAEELKKALAIPGYVTLDGNVESDVTIDENISVSIDLADNTLDGILNNKGDLNVSNGTVEAKYVNNYGSAVFNDVEIKAGTTTDYANISREGSATQYNNVNLDAGGGGVAAVGGAKVVFNSGSVAINSASTSGRYNFYAEGDGSEITINGGVFSFSKTLNQKRAYIYAGSGTTVYINGGSFGAASTRKGYTAGILGDGQIIITGGTFGFDPSNWVAEHYKAIKSDNVWIVVAE